MSESRIQILDRLSIKWSRINRNCIPVNSFKEWLIYYDYMSTLQLVYIAMHEYSMQERINKL